MTSEVGLVCEPVPVGAGMGGADGEAGTGNVSVPG